MKPRIIVAAAVLSFAAGSASAQLVPNSPSAKATVTVGTQTFNFQGGGCLIKGDSWAMALGDATKAEHLELNIPAPVRASAADAVKPTQDGSYTNVSLTVIVDAVTGIRWHAGGRTASEASLTVTLKNNRRAGEFTGRTDGSPRQDIKGTFSC
jgi:hypothetical protein